MLPTTAPEIDHFPPLSRKRPRLEPTILNRNLIPRRSQDGLPDLSTPHQLWLWRRTLKPGDRLNVCCKDEFRHSIRNAPPGHPRNTWNCLVPEDMIHDLDAEWEEAVVILRTSTEIRIHIVGGHPTRDHNINIDLLPATRIRPMAGECGEPVPFERIPRTIHVSDRYISLPPFQIQCRLSKLYPPSDAFRDFEGFHALCIFQQHLGREPFLQISDWQEPEETRIVRDLLCSLLTQNGHANNLPRVFITSCLPIQPCSSSSSSPPFEPGWQYYQLTMGTILYLTESCADIDLPLFMPQNEPTLVQLKQREEFLQQCLDWNECGSSIHSLMNLHLPTSSTGSSSSSSSSSFPYSEVLRTELRDYQEQTVKWLIEQESAPFGIGGVFGVPINISERLCWYWSHSQVVESMSTMTHKSLTTWGGILADEMGLGKTIEILTLLALRPARDKKATLILVPTSLLGQWQREIDHHLLHKPRVLVWGQGASKRKNKWEDLPDKFDIVLCSYGSLPSSQPNLEWHRVICDEAHRITVNGHLYRKLLDVKASRRWMLTGTPVKRQIEEFRGMLGVLGVDDLIIWSRFRRLNQNNINSHNSHNIFMHHPQILAREETYFLHLLCGRLMMRHVKDQSFNGRFPLLHLPAVHNRTIRVNMTPDERKQYLALGRQIPSLLADPHHRFNQLIQILPLRQFCSGGLLPLSLFGNGLYESLPIAQQGQSYNSVTEECSICFELMEHPVQTLCRHVFCDECIQSLLESSLKHQCPICRKSLRAKELKRLVVDDPASSESAAATPPSAPVKQVRSKIDHVLNYYNDLRKEDPFIKIIIFTHFRLTQTLLSTLLPTFGFRAFSLSSNMLPARRQKELDGFIESKGSSVLLLGMRTGNCGLSLVGANHVCIFEPWINPSMDQQAVNRVLRIGQTRPVTISRFIMTNSVEERLYELHLHLNHTN